VGKREDLPLTNESPVPPYVSIPRRTV